MSVRLRIGNRIFWAFSVQNICLKGIKRVQNWPNEWYEVWYKYVEHQFNFVVNLKSRIENSQSTTFFHNQKLLKTARLFFVNKTIVYIGTQIRLQMSNGLQGNRLVTSLSAKMASIAPEHVSILICCLYTVYWSLFLKELYLRDEKSCKKMMAKLMKLKSYILLLIIRNVELFYSY